MLKLPLLEKHKERIPKLVMPISNTMILYETERKEKHEKMKIFYKRNVGEKEIYKQNNQELP